MPARVSLVPGSLPRAVRRVHRPVHPRRWLFYKQNKTRQAGERRSERGAGQGEVGVREEGGIEAMLSMVVAPNKEHLCISGALAARTSTIFLGDMF